MRERVGGGTVAGAIEGIPCTIRSPRIHGAFRDVFTAIQRYPRDWARLRRRVRAIEWLPTDVEGASAQFLPDVADDEECDEGKILRVPGAIRVARNVRGVDMPGILAHECGHAVTRHRDWLIREGDGIRSFGQILENCADMYAFKWGFEDQVRAGPPRPLHHSVLPGATITVGGRTYRLDRQFMFRPA